MQNFKDVIIWNEDTEKIKATFKGIYNDLPDTLGNNGFYGPLVLNPDYIYFKFV